MVLLIKIFDNTSEGNTQIASYQKSLNQIYPNPQPQNPKFISQNTSSQISLKISPKDRKKVSLIYYAFGTYGNFGDELSKFIIEQLTNHEKYDLVYNDKSAEIQIVGIGSMMHTISQDGTIVYGTGTLYSVAYANLNSSLKSLKVAATRGPKTWEFLKSRMAPNQQNLHIDVLKSRTYEHEDQMQTHPEMIYGDPGLLIAKFYQPKKFPKLANKYCLIPHYVHFDLYKKTYNSGENAQKWNLVDVTDPWWHVADQIFSCKGTVSSSLHGLILSDAYDKPNLMLDPEGHSLTAGQWKFEDYFLSQGRKTEFVTKPEDASFDKMYKDGNKIDLDRLAVAYPLK